MSLGQEQARNQVMTDIRSAIAQKAKASGYDFVFDTSGNTANSAPSLVFHSGKHDITQAVLTVLNANAPAQQSTSSNNDKSTGSTESKTTNAPPKKN